MSGFNILYKNDKVFNISKDKSLQLTPAIIITNVGEILIGHYNVFKINYDKSNGGRYWDYKYFTSLDPEIFEVIAKNIELSEFIENVNLLVDDNLRIFLSDADCNEINNAYEYFLKVIMQKKYVLIEVDYFSNEDWINITMLNNFKEAEMHIENVFNDNNYFGFSNVDFNKREYYFLLIATDDERLCSKYTDVLLYDEFKHLDYKNFDDNFYKHLEGIWNGNYRRAEKHWGVENFETHTSLRFTNPFNKWIVDVE